MATDPNTPNNAFASNSGGAAFGNPNIVRSGQRAGATQATAGAGRGFVNPQVVNPDSPPPNATAAPKGDTKYGYLGLCEALNQYEQDLVKAGTVEIANFYEVQFAPASLASSKVKIPGQTDKSLTPMQQSNSAQSKVDPASNSMNIQGMNKSISQGTQIVQFIETVMRNSSYITDQQKSVNDPVTGNNTPSSSATSSDATTDWFKINVQAIPISDKIDKKRNDYAYHMTYLISTYGINQLQSQYFPDAKFRGVHKVYNYWFTGENTQILYYNQTFNNMWFNVINGDAPVQNNGSPLAQQISWQNKNVPATRSGQTDQQAPNGALNPASTAADFLYNFTDQQNISLKIIGDPAWIQQGEIVGINAPDFNFQGFYPDGTINTDAQQAVFVVNWNAPADYNIDTGLVDVNAEATNGNNNNLLATQPAASAAYVAMGIKSTFRKGVFEQELTGCLLTNLNQQQIANATGTGTGGGQSSPDFAALDPRRTDFPNSNDTNAGGGQSSPNFAANDPRRLDLPNNRTPSLQSNDISDPNLISRTNQNSSQWPQTPSNTPAMTPASISVITKPSLQPSAPATPPTSNNNVVGSALLPGPAFANAFLNTTNGVRTLLNSPNGKTLNTQTQTMAPKDE